MERSDEVIQAATQRRIAAALRLGCEALETEDADRALRENQAALLRHAYTALLLAGRGYHIDPAQLSERIGMKIEAAQMPPAEGFSPRHGDKEVRT